MTKLIKLNYFRYSNKGYKYISSFEDFNFKNGVVNDRYMYINPDYIIVISDIQSYYCNGRTHYFFYVELTNSPTTYWVVAQDQNTYGQIAEQLVQVVSSKQEKKEEIHHLNKKK